MNETIRQLFDRKSVRAYLDRDISDQDKAVILEAATQAPTAGNQQLYTILDITDQDVKDRLSETCDHQPFIAKAKMVLIFCADCKKWYDAYLAGGIDARKPDVGDFMIAFSDANIAAQNAVVAAHSLGIGSCYIGDIMENYEEHVKLLHLPEYVFPAAMLVFGYPVEQQKKREKPERAAMKYIVHENGYHSLEPEDLKEMLMKDTGNEDFSVWIRKFCERKYESDFVLEMSRSVRTFMNTLGKDKK